MDYKIVHYVKENEWAIKSEWEQERRLAHNDWEWVRTYKEEWAKRFFHEETAISTLVIIKHKWELKTEQEYQEPEKQSWSEL